MKKYILQIMIVLLSSCLSLLQAQAPQTMNYQAVARNAGGIAIANQLIGLRLSIRPSLTGGVAIYEERDTATTNQFGLFTTEIGRGTPLTGTFAGIDWSTGDKFLYVEIDVAGGTNYSHMGTTQLLSVPYALHAKTSGDNNWQKNGNDISNSNTGNVGIGTATPHPSYKLEISGIYTGLLKLTGSTCCTQITMDDLSANDVYLTTTMGRFSIWTGGNFERLSILPGGNIGIGTTTPAASAALEISSTTGALLLPRLTTVQRGALTPAEGMVIYNTDANKFQGYAGSGWVDLH